MVLRGDLLHIRPTSVIAIMIKALQVLSCHHSLAAHVLSTVVLIVSATNKQTFRHGLNTRLVTSLITYEAAWCA